MVLNLLPSNSSNDAVPLYPLNRMGKQEVEGYGNKKDNKRSKIGTTQRFKDEDNILKEAIKLSMKVKGQSLGKGWRIFR